MKIKSSEFVAGVTGTDRIVTDGIPQIAFVGRSNVGKSSVINSLCHKKDLVKVGKKPGKTTEINFFSINKRQFYFVDLPGYGFALLDPKEKEKIGKLISWYLTDSGAKPFAVVIILDIKVGITDFDRDMLDLCRSEGLHYHIVANKADKLNQKELHKALEEIQKESMESRVIPCSATEKGGVRVLLEEIFRDSI